MLLTYTLKSQPKFGHGEQCLNRQIFVHVGIAFTNPFKGFGQWNITFFLGQNLILKAINHENTKVHMI